MFDEVQNPSLRKLSKGWLPQAFIDSLQDFSQWCTLFAICLDVDIIFS